MTSIALFDFDGTLTKKDSLLDFLQFTIGFPKLLLGSVCLSPVLLAYFFKRLDNHSAKERIIGYFFSGWNEDRLKAAGDRYALKRIPQILRLDGKKCLQWHRQQGHRICIVSASPDIWLKAWASEQKIYLIATRLEMCDRRFTGKFAGRNCHGVEKIHRIKAQFNLGAYDMIYAYGDSAGDRPMLALADEAFFKPFR